jgi:hypothetical protein
MDEILVDITSEDISEGKPGSCGKCPIALAATRAMGRQVTVGATTIGEFFGTRYWNLPEIAMNFIADFDCDRPVKPFSFPIIMADHIR